MKRTLLSNFFLFILISITSTVNAQKIGLLMDSYVTPRWYLDQKLFIDKVKELGGEVQVEVAYGDPVEQVKLGKKLLAEGVKVLVIVAVDGNKAAEIVIAAKAVNVPVIAYDRLINSKDLTMYISYNNEKVGELQAQYAVNKISTGNYLLMNGPGYDINAVSFKKGQLTILKPYIDSGKIKIIGDLLMNDWGQMGAFIKTDEFFSTSKEQPAVILAANDALADGIIQALPVGLKGNVLITGQDADLTAIKYIVMGLQSMTIYKPIKPLAQLAAETAVLLARGETVKGSVKVKHIYIEVEAILLDPIPVDKQNYKDTVLKDGHVSLSEFVDKKK